MDLIGSYSSKPIPRVRRTTIDLGRHGTHRHHVKGLLELDVTDARRLIHEYRNTSGNGLSFTAWIVKCISQAIVEHPQAQAYRKGERRLIIFDDVDVVLPVERELAGEKLPLTYILRKANEKTLDQINSEIEQATRAPLRDDETRLGEMEHKSLEHLYMRMPGFIRSLIWRRLNRNPFFAKRYMGTVLVTTLVMYGKLDGWPVPFTIHPVCFALGSVVRKPGIAGERIEPREFLKLTVLIDHDVIDGAPAARFVARLGELIEGAALL